MPCMRSERGKRRLVPYVELVPKLSFLSVPVQLPTSSQVHWEQKHVLTQDCIALLRSMVTSIDADEAEEADEKGGLVEADVDDEGERDARARGMLRRGRKLVDSSDE
eukprot:2861333-Pleurochrysis_carterae.AAC.1